MSLICGCGVLGSASKPEHELGDCRCRHHEPALCATCTEKRLAKELVVQLETMLRAAAGIDLPPGDPEGKA